MSTFMSISSKRYLYLFIMYYKALTYTVMEAKKSLSLSSANCKPRKNRGVV